MQIADIDIDENRETLDSMFHGRVSLIQHKSGYRFSVDAVLLADFVRHMKRGYCVDLGTGCGVIPLLLLDLGKIETATGIEIQGGLCSLARRNAEINGRKDVFEVMNCDLKDLRDCKNAPPNQSCSLVCSNPPFYHDGSGKTPKDEESFIARHENKCNMRDVLIVAKRLLAPKGRSVFIYPAARSFELLSTLSDLKMNCSRFRPVYGKAEDEARLVLVEAMHARSSPMIIESPLILEDSEGNPSPEAQRIYSGLKG